MAENVQERHPRNGIWRLSHFPIIQPAIGAPNSIASPNTTKEIDVQDETSASGTPDQTVKEKGSTDTV